MARQNASLAKHRVIERDLLAEITSGRLAVGDQIETGGEISKKYGVSLPTADKAITSLAAKGFLKRMQSRGTFVRDWRTAAAKNRKANSISLICANLNSVEMGFYGQFINEASREAQENGYHLNIGPMDAEDEDFVPLAIRTREAAGSIVLGMLTEDQANVLREYDVPHLFVGNHEHTFGYPCVRYDMRNAGYQITKRLLELDRGDVWLLSEPTVDLPYAQEGFEGYQQAVLERDAECHVHLARAAHRVEGFEGVVNQIEASGADEFCMMGFNFYLHCVSDILKARKSNVKWTAVTMPGQSVGGGFISESMMVCDITLSLLLKECIRQIIAAADKGAAVAGKEYSLKIENTDNGVKPLRLWWE